MKVKYKFCLTSDCDLSFIDSSEYLDSSTEGLVFREFKQEDIQIVDVLEKHIIDADNTIQYSSKAAFGENSFINNDDGLYTLYHLMIPTKEYFDNAFAVGGVLYQYETFYYYDGEKFWKFYENESTETTLNEIISRNLLNTSVLYICRNYFLTCKLKQCYLKLSEAVLSGYLKCQNKNNPEIYFNRDLVWMALNVIQYYSDLDDWENALITYNRLQGCGRVCENVTKSSGCGCR